MKNKILSALVVILIGIFANITLTSNSGGISGKYSGSSCGGCHGSANSSTLLYLTGIPTSGYIPGNTYSMTITILNTTKSAAGFDLHTNLGTISNNDTGTAIVNNNELRHITPKIYSGNSVSWTFDWTAPILPYNVTFSVAGNAVNMNTTNSGDHWNLTTFAFNPASSSPYISNGSNYPSAYSAYVLGSVNPSGATTSSIYVESGTTIAYGHIDFPTTTQIVSGNSFYPKATTITSLLPNTLYHYRYVAVNSIDTTYGADTFFTTLSVALPVVMSYSPNNVSNNSAIISGTVNANNDTVNIFTIEYGPTSSYGFTKNVGQSIYSSVPNGVNTTLQNLMPNTLYHYRIVASNNIGTGYSIDRTFTTLGEPTMVATSANNITAFAAKLNATLNPNGSQTYNVKFEYGINTSYGSVSPTATTYSGTSPLSIFVNVANLLPGTLYHYRVFATNNYGTAYSADQTFTTLAPDAIFDLKNKINQIEILYLLHTNLATIQLSESINCKQINSINMNGAMLPLPFVINNNKIVIQTDNLASGLYTIQFINNGKKYSGKLLKL